MSVEVGLALVQPSPEATGLPLPTGQGIRLLPWEYEQVENPEPHAR